MTDLFKQLEDKKKGCGKKFGVRDERIQEPFICGTKQGEITIKCPQCRAEIAILEQAITEIKKRDKDIDELAESSTFALCALMKENKDLKDEMQKQRQEISKSLRERIMRNGNLSNRIIENNYGEFEHKHDYILNEIVCEIIEETLQQLNQPKTEE